MLHDPVDRRDDLRYIRCAHRVGHLDAHDPSFGRDPVGVVVVLEAGPRAEDQKTGSGRSIATGDDAGHVGAVPEGVEVGEVRGSSFEGEVWTVNHLAGSV
jgi:hypothetical protein